MTVSTIDDQKFLLIDNWPGKVDHNLGIPTGGFTGSAHHNVVAAKYPIGAKIQAYDSTSNGYATFVYLQFVQGSVGVLAAKDVVGIDISEQSTDATADTWYKVTSDGGEAQVQGPLAVALSAVTTAYFGWFWCGGVCPVALVSDLDGNYLTNNLLAAGKAITGSDVSTGLIGFTPVPDISNTTAAVASGLALIDDA